MSVLDFFAYLDAHPWLPVAWTVGLPVITLLLRPIHGAFRGALAPWKYCYTALVYLTCVPGIFVLFAALYQFVFVGANLLALDLALYALPVLSMIVTLLAIRRTVRFDDIPGFRRITGLVAITVATFAILLILDRMRILLFFRASILIFILVGVAIFLALKVGGRLLLGK